MPVINRGHHITSPPFPHLFILHQFDIILGNTHAAHHTAHKSRPGSIQGPSRPADITNLQFTSKSD